LIFTEIGSRTRSTDTRISGVRNTPIIEGRLNASMMSMAKQNDRYLNITHASVTSIGYTPKSQMLDGKYTEL